MPAQHLVISLVYSLADSLWMAALLWLFYRFIEWLLPLKPIHAYRLAGALVTVLFLGWLAVFLLYLLGGNSVSALALNHLPKITTIVIPNSWMYVAAFFYLLGLSFQVLRFSYAYLQMRSLLKHTVPLPGNWKTVLERHTRHFTGHNTIKAFLSDRISSPLTFGWLKPVILFPVASVNGLDINQFESILLHEIAHIRRNDFLLERVLTCMEMILFFNPFSRDLFRTIRCLREECCDDAVLEAGTLPLHYVTALSWCARQGVASGGTLGAVGKEKELLNRILRMTKGTRTKKEPVSYPFWVALVCLFVGLQLSTIKTSMQAKQAMSRTGWETKKSVIAKVTQDNRLIPPTVTIQKKVVRQSAGRKIVNDQSVNKTVDMLETEPITGTNFIRTVSSREGLNLSDLQQGWIQIKQLSQEQLSQLISEALQDLSTEEKIIWARLFRNKLLEQETMKFTGDSTMLMLPGYAENESTISPEESRLQSKLMLLIWMKWRDKYPSFMERKTNKYPADSGHVIPHTEQ